MRANLIAALLSAGVTALGLEAASACPRPGTSTSRARTSTRCSWGRSASASRFTRTARYTRCASTTTATTGGLIEYHFDQFGARWIRPAERPTEGPGVLVVGDSFTLGFGLRYEDAYVYKLERLLEQRGVRVRLLNFAEPGADARRCLEIYRETRERAPHQALLYGMNLNDLIEFDTSDVILDREARIAGFAWTRAHSRLADFVLRRIERARSRARTLARLTAPSVFDRPFYAENMRAIERMKAECEERGGRFLVALLPILVDVRGDTFDAVHARIRRAFEGRGIRYLDLSASVRAHADSELWILPFDQHPNEVANDAYARRLAESLAREWGG